MSDHKVADEFGTHTYKKGAGMYRCPVSGDFDGPADGPDMIVSPSGHDARRIGQKLELIDFTPADDFEKVKAAKIAAAAEKGKTHPLADSYHELNVHARTQAGAKKSTPA